MQENTVFSTLNAINCNEHTERKGNLTYLSGLVAVDLDFTVLNADPDKGAVTIEGSRRDIVKMTVEADGIVPSGEPCVACRYAPPADFGHWRWLICPGGP